MNDNSRSKTYKFEFSGDLVVCVIAPVPAEKAEQWLQREPEALFSHAFGGDENDDHYGADVAHLGRASELPGAKWLEGCELKHGTLEITGSEGEEVANYSLEDEEFQDFIDDMEQIDPDSYLLDGGTTLITRIVYTGHVVYETEPFEGSFEDAGWYVAVTDMGGEPFISTVNFENETLTPGGSGKFGLQEVWLNVPGDDGEIRQLYHSEMPEPLTGEITYTGFSLGTDLTKALGIGVRRSDA